MINICHEIYMTTELTHINSPSHRKKKLEHEEYQSSLGLMPSNIIYQISRHINFMLQLMFKDYYKVENTWSKFKAPSIMWLLPSLARRITQNS